MAFTKRTMPWDKASHSREVLLSREWLVTNGLGGYASGTVAGAATRRYHGLLIAALPAPHGRMMMLNHVFEQLRLPDGRVIPIGGEEREGMSIQVHSAGHLKEFRLEAGLPVWTFAMDGYVIEKQLMLLHMQNTVLLTYRMVSGEGTVRLEVRPSVHFREHEEPVSKPLASPYVLTAIEDRYELSAGGDLPPLRMHLHGQRAAFTVYGKCLPNIMYRI